MDVPEAQRTRQPAASRRRVIVDDGALALRIGGRIRQRRQAAGLTQAQLAGARYTKAYISALETGHSKPSMAALRYLAERLGVPATVLIDEEPDRLRRLDLDIRLASGQFQGAADGYQTLLEEDQAPGARAELLAGLAEALTGLSRGMEAASAAAEAVRLFTAAGRTAEAAGARYHLANAEYMVGNEPEAERIFGELLTGVRSGLRVEPDFEARILMALAAIATKDGRHAVALAYLEEIRGIAASLDDRRRAAFLSDLSYAYRETGDFEAALRTGTASLALYRASRFDLGTASLENDLALSYLGVGNAERAREMAASAVGRFEAMGDHRWLAHVIETQAQIALATGDLAEAASLATRSLALGDETHNDKAAVSALRTLARTAARSGLPAEALAYAEQAAVRARANGSPGMVRDALRDWAELLSEAGDHARAFALLREAMDAR